MSSDVRDVLDLPERTNQSFQPPVKKARLDPPRKLGK